MARKVFEKSSLPGGGRQKKPTISFSKEKGKKMQEGKEDNMRRRMGQIALTHTRTACKNKSRREARSSGNKRVLHCRHCAHQEFGIDIDSLEGHR